MVDLTRNNCDQRGQIPSKRSLSQVAGRLDDAKINPDSFAKPQNWFIGFDRTVGSWFRPVLRLGALSFDNSPPLDGAGCSRKPQRDCVPRSCMAA